MKNRGETEAWGTGRQGTAGNGGARGTDSRLVTVRKMRVGVAVGGSAGTAGAGRPATATRRGPAEPGPTPLAPPAASPFRSPEALSRPALSGGRYFGLRSERGDYF